MAAVARLNRIWRIGTTIFASKFRLYKSLVNCETWTLLTDSEKRIQSFETKCLRKLLVSHTWRTRATTGYETGSTFSWFHRNLFWELSRDGNLCGSGMSHAITASPKSSFRASWTVCDAVVGRENAGWTTCRRIFRAQSTA